MPAVVTTARDIFLSALDQANPSERAAFINQACADDLVLQRHVEALLRNHEQADSLLDQPRISLQAADPNLGSPPATLDQLITEQPGTLIGPYKLLEQIGEGGMGKRVAGAHTVWDAQTGDEVFTLFTPSRNAGGGGTTVAFSPDGKYLASGDLAGTKLWNAQNGQELRTLPGGAPDTPFCPVVAFSPDSKRLAGGGYHGHAKVWDVETGEEILMVKSGDGRFGLAFSPDGKRLVSSYKVWDAETGLELLSLPAGGYGIAFSAHGHRLVSNIGGRLKIFDATPLPEQP